MTRRPVFLALCFLLALPALARAEIPIKRIDVEGLRSIKKSELIYLLCLSNAASIDRVKLSYGIKRAFKKGIFDYIEVDQDPNQPGVIRVVVREHDVIDEVRFKGGGDISGKLLRNNFILKPEGFMRYGLIDQAARTLKEAVSRAGYPDAKVSVSTEKGKTPYRVKVTVHIDRGKPLIVKHITVIGRPADEVTGYLRLSPGDVFNQSDLARGMEELGNHYRKKGYYDPIVGPYAFSAGELYIKVDPGRKLFVKISGNSNISRKKLKKLLPFMEAGDVRDDLVEEAAQRMRTLYHEQGYAGVQIASVLKTEPDAEVVNFYINEGRRVAVASVHMPGASTVPEKKLEEIIALEKGSVYSPERIADDAGRIKSFYQSLGYLDAAVSGPEVVSTPKGMEVSFQIKEGSRYHVAGVRVEGAGRIPAGEITNAIGIKAGDPYNDVDIANARYRVLDMYSARGFYNSAVDVRREFSGSNATLVFKITEGPQRFFGKSIIVGNKKTKTGVIERELEHREGQPFNQKVLMTEMQKLYELGLFSEVNVEAVKGYGAHFDTVYRVREAKAGAVEFGLGYGEFEKERGFVSLSYGNLFGEDRKGSVRFEFSSLEDREILQYDEPWFLGYNVPFRAFLLREDREEKNIDTDEILYKLRRYSVNAGVEKKLTDRVKGEFYYEFSLVNTYNVKPDVVLTREDVGTLAISAVRPAIEYDSRDNPFDPKKGVFAGVSFKLASSAFLSETNFGKLIAQVSTYHRLFKPFVLALRAETGLAQGYGQTNELPIVERFFLGGRNTVRGYAQDTLGPKTPAGDPIGGNAFLLGNVEVRTALTKSLGLVNFVDMGNVWLKIGDMNPGDLRYTTGIGFRYQTPVGPIRVDYGIKLNRQPGESSGELHFSIGQAF